MSIQGFRLQHLQSGENYKASEVKKCGLKHLTRAGVQIDTEVSLNYAKIIERHLREEEEQEAKKQPVIEEALMLDKKEKQHQEEEQEEKKQIKFKR